MTPDQCSGSFKAQWRAVSYARITANAALICINGDAASEKLTLQHSAATVAAKWPITHPGSVTMRGAKARRLLQGSYDEMRDREASRSWRRIPQSTGGEGRDRGQATVDLKRLYERAGYELSSSELPDYLPVVLEYLSCRDLREARELLSDCAHILRRIGQSLIARSSRYAAVLQALLVVAGEDPIDAAAVPPVRERHENLDHDWYEQPAFAGEPLSAARANGIAATASSLRDSPPPR